MMDKTRKYKLPEDEPQMASEAVMAVPVELRQTEMAMYMYKENAESQSDDDMPAFVLDDINQAIVEGDCEIEKGEWCTHEEAMKQICKLLES